MRTIVAWTMTLAVAAGISATALAQQPQGTTAPAPADPKAEEARLKAREELNALLETWEKHSKKIDSLDMEFERIDKDQVWGDRHYKCRAMFKNPDLVCLEFTKVKLDAAGKPLTVTAKDGKPAKAVEDEPTERIVWTGKEVLQYNWDDRKVFVFPLNKLARQKGTLPFLSLPMVFRERPFPLRFFFDVKADEAKRRYSMTLVKQDDTEYLIEIIPSEAIDKESFIKAFLWLSKETFLPNQLRLYPVGNKEYQQFVFVGGRNVIRPNVPMDKNFFVFREIPGWKTVSPSSFHAAIPMTWFW